MSLRDELAAAVAENPSVSDGDLWWVDWSDEGCGYDVIEAVLGSEALQSIRRALFESIPDAEDLRNGLSPADWLEFVDDLSPSVIAWVLDDPAAVGVMGDTP